MKSVSKSKLPSGCERKQQTKEKEEEEKHRQQLVNARLSLLLTRQDCVLKVENK